MIIEAKHGKMAALLIVVGLIGCTRITTRTELQEVGAFDGSNGGSTVIESTELAQRGTATMVWEEPMVDTVDVPPGLDPEGHYYRPAHKAIVEIRQGRWQYYQREGKK